MIYELLFVFTNSNDKIRCPVNILLLLYRIMYNSYKTVLVNKIADNVICVELNRPEKRNALDQETWKEIGDVFVKLNEDADCKAVLLCGSGQSFCSGIDMLELVNLAGSMSEKEDVAYKSLYLLQTLRKIQDQNSSIEKCRKPVICCIQVSMYSEIFN